MNYKLGDVVTFIRDSDQYMNRNFPRAGTVAKIVAKDKRPRLTYLLAIWGSKYGWECDNIVSLLDDRQVKYIHYIGNYKKFWWLYHNEIDKYVTKGSDEIEI